MTGVIPRRPQVRDRGGLIDWPHSSSKTIQPPRAAAVLSSAARPPSSTPPPRSHPLDGPARADLAGPAAAAQKVPDPRDGVLHPELADHQVADASQRPPLVPPSGGRPAGPPAPHPAWPAAAHPAGTAPPARGRPAQPAPPAALVTMSRTSRPGIGNLGATSPRRMDSWHRGQRGTSSCDRTISITTSWQKIANGGTEPGNDGGEAGRTQEGEIVGIANVPKVTGSDAARSGARGRAIT